MAFSEDIKAKEKVKYYNLTQTDSKVYVGVKGKANGISEGVYEEKMMEVPFIKYSIKETEGRVKTAKLTLPHNFDLTNGVHQVKIVSKFHENFCGQILSDEYTENSDGSYSYQLQDMSREYQGKRAYYFTNLNLYRFYQSLLTAGKFKINDKVTPTAKDAFKKVWSGLRPIECYNGKLWNNPLSTNWMEEKPNLIARNDTYIEIMRSIGRAKGYVQIYFNENGILQIEPYSVTDWQNTGLYLTANETIKRQFKFDVTNVITSTAVAPKEKYDFNGVDYINPLDLRLFFGDMRDRIETSDTTKTSTSNSTSTSSSSSSTGNNGNPFNSKAKKAYVDADDGSGDFKSSFIKELKNKGWTVKDGGTGPGTHYADYSNVTKDYACLVTIYNGFCAGTIKEAYSSTIQNKLKNKGVQLVVVFDTRTWTNPKGMKPYRNGDFTGYSAKRAWDDNFSSSDPSIKNVSDFFKKNNAVYCASPTVSGAIEQFVAGGYYKWKK